ncbi:caspase family protein [bacterium]|nr:caspase family protein [bacterium]
MKRKTGYVLCLITAGLMLGWLFPCQVSGVGTDAECSLARKIGEEAAKTFAKNKTEALKLFIKANGLCPDDPAINYNLGLAYYRNGNLKEAQTHLKKSIEKEGGMGHRLNLLAWVMLDIGAEKAQALEYAKKAVKAAPDSAEASDTLVRALLENGLLYEAAVEAKNASARFKGKEIEGRYREAIDAYTAFYLKKTKAGEHDEAIAGLKRIDFDPDVVNAYCWALFAAGRMDEALMEAEKAKGKFEGNDSVKETFDRIMDGFVQGCYKDFKEGRRAEAVKAVDDMKKIYPSNKGLADAYDNMMKVVLSDLETITVPEPVFATSGGAKRGGESAGLLDDIRAGGTTLAAVDDLKVDVDRDIPVAKRKNPNAIAVIIGNRNYSGFGHGIPDVDYAKRDAMYIRKYVTGVMGYSEENIIIKIDATKAEMEKIFGTRQDFRGKLYNFVKSGVRSESAKPDVFVYYTGHGAPSQKGDDVSSDHGAPARKGDDAFLVPVDADADYISTNGYPVGVLYDNLERLPANRVMVVLDACFCGKSPGGAIFKNVSPAIYKSASPVREVANGVVFASAGKDEMSNWYPEMGHSLFTYFFMKGLKGDADRDGDKAISVKELKEYLYDEVPRKSLRIRGGSPQTPLILGDDAWEIARLK